MSKQSLWGWQHQWGLLLHQVAPKGKRFMLPNAEYMIHQPMGGTGGGTQQTDMAIAAEHLLKTRKTLEQILADNSGKSVEQIHADAERDYWMSAQETLEYGFIDEIISIILAMNLESKLDEVCFFDIIEKIS